MTRPERYRLLLYGPSGIGKTTFAADCHGPAGECLSIYAAPPQNHQAVRDRPHLVASNLGELTQIIERGPLGDFETVALDDMQATIGWLIEAIEKRTGKDFDDLEFARGYRALTVDVMSLLGMLGRRSNNLVVISRERQEVTIDKTIKKAFPDMAPSVLRTVLFDFDFVAYAMPAPTPQDRDARTLSFVATRVTDAKDRWNLMGGACPLDGAEFVRRFRENPFTPRRKPDADAARS